MVTICRRLYLPTVLVYSQLNIDVNRRVLLSRYKINRLCTNIGKSTIYIKPKNFVADDDQNVGSELVGEVDQKDVNRLVKEFFNRKEVESIAAENGIIGDLLLNSRLSFQNLCGNVNHLPADLHVVLSDLINGHGHVLNLIPYFLQHAVCVYPHLKYTEELRNIGDLTCPAKSYPLARAMKRKIIFHYGPTNSGKTYHALKCFLNAKRGVYCAPLKLLAHEVFKKSNDQGVSCDIVTGEYKENILGEDQVADHVSCTVEMLNTNEEYDVAVIDEIQMLSNSSRGYAWTRAFLGVAAKEVHLCGEESALEFIRNMTEKLGEEFECHRYKRLTKLIFEKNAVENFKNIQSGDCIICFSKKEIYTVTNNLEKLGKKCAVIYGTLPPATKTAQTEAFNDPEGECNVLVATDAIGLGMNLNIRRVVFYSLHKMSNEGNKGRGERKRSLISVSLALQISGRAGRFQSQYPEGYVTTFKKGDLEILRTLLRGTPEPVDQAGLCPTCDQIETFSYYLPHLNLSELIDVFTSLCSVDPSFFMCDLSAFKYLADKIKHLNLPVKVAYTFSTAPVNLQSYMAQTLFVKFAKKYSMNEEVNIKFVKMLINWPLSKPKNINELVLLEDIFDCLDLYLWLANRYPISFPDAHSIKDLQSKIDFLIMNGVVSLVVNAKRQNEYDEDGSESVENFILENDVLSPALLEKLKLEWIKKENIKSLGSMRGVPVDKKLPT